jgi:outer membrane protein TolC
LVNPVDGCDPAEAAILAVRNNPDLNAKRQQLGAVRAQLHSTGLLPDPRFPSFSIGITRARDTSSVHTTGFDVGFNRPIFSGNRGAIGIERATREQLRGEYQARLDQAAVDVDGLIRLQTLVAAQQMQLDRYLTALEQMADRGREAYRHGDIDALTFLNMESTWINKRREQISLDQPQRENLIALQTLPAIPADGAPRTDGVSEGGQP